jgi:hypothetical protein
MKEKPAMNQPQILNIQLGVNGVQTVLNALAKLPFDQVAELIAVIRVQAEQQLSGSKNRAAPVETPVAEDNEGATAD